MFERYNHSCYFTRSSRTPPAESEPPEILCPPTPSEAPRAARMKGNISYNWKRNHSKALEEERQKDDQNQLEKDVTLR